MAGPIDLYVVAGQSNAEGRGNSALSPAVDPAFGYEYNGSGSVVALADPVGNAATGSAWPAFANAVIRERARPLCITETAGSGRALLPASDNGNGDWSATGTHYGPAVTRATATLTKLTADGWTPTLRAILWHQGETDGETFPGTATDLQAQYQAGLLDLHDRFKADLGPVAFCVFQVGRPNTADTTKFAAVRAAQQAAADSRADMVMAYTGCVGFPALGLMQDALHYTQAGYNLMGGEGGTTIARALYGGPRRKSRIAASGGQLLSARGRVLFA